MMSAIVEIKTLEHVILFKFQKMMNGGTARQVLSFSGLWTVCSNAACRMQELGVHHPLREKKEFAKQFFAAVNALCAEGVAWKREESNGDRKQLTSAGLTEAGREKVSTIIFGNQQLAQEPEVIWNTKALNRYRGPII